jgi:NAD(P)-dependent dehydrogenase (short-subunit alcohol dehydrogenase family)
LISAHALFDVKDRVIAVTGGAGQLGGQFALSLAAAGAHVAVLDRRPAKLDDERIISFPCDVTDRASLENALAAIEAQWEAPYGLVNAAAIDSPPNAPPEENGPFETYPLSSWERILSVNITGTFLCCQVFGGAMAARGSGSIINVASIYGMVSPDQALYQYRRDRGEVFFKPAAYSVSKSAVYNLTRYLAVYWGGRSVRVNTVTFGGVFNNQEPAFLERYHAKVPLGRMADQSEYSGVIQFLLSDASSYMTGSNVVVDGGFTAM